MQAPSRNRIITANHVAENQGLISIWIPTHLWSLDMAFVLAAGSINPAKPSYVILPQSSDPTIRPFP